MSDNEFDRYRKLLEDWKPGGAPSKAAGPEGSSRGMKQGFVPEPMVIRRPPAQAASVSRVQPMPAPTTATVTAPAAAPQAMPGSILVLNGHTVVVCLREVPDKSYHLVLVLTPNGTIKLQGVALTSAMTEEIGKVPPQVLQQMESSMRWTREVLVFHCYRFEDVARIPNVVGDGVSEPAAAPAAQTEAPRPAPLATPAPAPESPNTPTRRGQRLHIKFGGNSWEAVYWGKDMQNHVVAHKTYHKWALMHLDLERFRHGLEVDPMIDEVLVAEIEKSLMQE